MSESPASLLYAEALRLRSMQEARLDDVRKRSAAALAVVTAAVALAAGVGGSVDRLAVAVTLVGFVVHAMAAARIQLGFSRYVEGPDVSALYAHQFSEGLDAEEIKRDLARLHYDDWSGNNDVIRRMMWWARVQALGLVVVVVSLVVGVA